MTSIAHVPAGPRILLGLCAHRRGGDLQRRAGFPQAKERQRGHDAPAAGAIAITMMLSIINLADKMGLKYVDPNDLDRLTIGGEPVPSDYDQHAVIARWPGDLPRVHPAGFYFVVTVTGIILVLAANTAFNGFPVLGSILARDGYAPQCARVRGDRLAYSNGIVFLAVMAIVLIQIFQAEDDPADPALHRGRVRLVQPQSARHDPPLDAAPAHRDRPGRAQDGAVARHQRGGPDLHRRRPGGRPHHEVLAGA